MGTNDLASRRAKETQFPTCCNPGCGALAEWVTIESLPQGFCQPCYEERAARLECTAVTLKQWQIEICPPIPHPPHLGCHACFRDDSHLHCRVKTSVAFGDIPAGCVGACTADLPEEGIYAVWFYAPPIPGQDARWINFDHPSKRFFEPAWEEV